LLDDAEVDATADVAAVGVLAVVAGFAMGVLEQSAALVLGAAEAADEVVTGDAGGWAHFQA